MTGLLLNSQNQFTLISLTLPDAKKDPLNGLAQSRKVTIGL